jgi:hypothetical protein
MKKLVALLLVFAAVGFADYVTVSNTGTDTIFDGYAVCSAPDTIAVAEWLNVGAHRDTMPMLDSLYVGTLPTLPDDRAYYTLKVAFTKNTTDTLTRQVILSVLDRYKVGKTITFKFTGDTICMPTANVAQVAKILRVVVVGRHSTDSVRVAAIAARPVLAYSSGTSTGYFAVAQQKIPPRTRGRALQVGSEAHVKLHAAGSPGYFLTPYTDGTFSATRTQPDTGWTAGTLIRYGAAGGLATANLNPVYYSATAGTGTYADIIYEDTASDAWRIGDSLRSNPAAATDTAAFHDGDTLDLHKMLYAYEARPESISYVVKGQSKSSLATLWSYAWGQEDSFTGGSHDGFIAGTQNTIADGADYSSIFGGKSNLITGHGAKYSTISGGLHNLIDGSRYAGIFSSYKSAIVNGRSSMILGGTRDTVVDDYNSLFGCRSVKAGGGGKHNVLFGMSYANEGDNNLVWKSGPTPADSDEQSFDETIPATTRHSAIFLCDPDTGGFCIDTTGRRTGAALTVKGLADIDSARIGAGLTLKTACGWTGAPIAFKQMGFTAQVWDTATCFDISNSRNYFLFTIPAADSWAITGLIVRTDSFNANADESPFTVVDSLNAATYGGVASSLTVMSPSISDASWWDYGDYGTDVQGDPVIGYTNYEVPYGEARVICLHCNKGVYWRGAVCLELKWVGVGNP